MKHIINLNHQKLEAAARKIRETRHIQVFSGIDGLPSGQATRDVTPGCIVLEGGGFRGTYTSGVLDALMLEGINLQCVVGVSAGALNGANYVSGDIGRAGRLNLSYRHDHKYLGVGALPKNKGIFGFDYVFGDIAKIHPFDEERFYDPARRFVAVATNCDTGQTVYLDRDECSDPFQAIRASASLPFVSAMVQVDGIPYLDGGCSTKVPYQWALDQGYQKIVVVRTRHRDYRANPTPNGAALKTYRHHPELADVMSRAGELYNVAATELSALADSGRIFMISPSTHESVDRLEKDMEKLGAWYLLGMHDAQDQMDALKAYLEI